jgi:hypothetical protein
MNFSLRWIFLVLLLLSFPVACLPSKKLTVGSAATLLEEVAKSSYKQSDLRVIREGMPAYLMLMDGMVEALPDNPELLIAAAQGYSSFASVFIEDQDKEYAGLLFAKAKHYALRSLEARGFSNPAEKPLDDFKNHLKTLGKRDLPYLFWGASCWASWISLNLNSMEAMAQLPRVEWMMQRVLEIDEQFYYGGAHLFMGIWFASRPKMAGGDLKKAQDHFLKAIQFGHEKFLMAHVYYANYYGRQARDKNLFISNLETVLKTPVDISPDLTLLNAVAKKKAKELFTRIEEYFE